MKNISNVNLEVGFPKNPIKMRFSRFAENISRKKRQYEDDRSIVNNFVTSRGRKCDMIVKNKNILIGK